MDEFQANAQQQQQAANISPKKPEEWTRYLDDVRRQIYPILEWHDNLIKTISEAIDKIPLIGELIEQIQNEINLFVFSVIAPYVMPIISQVKRELETGSSEVIQSSRAQQHNIFNDDNSTDPTHSMLSKDHFSNLLNEPAGKVAQTVVRWAVPQIMEAWDNENTDIDRTLTRIIHGVFHHPAHRGYGEDGQADIRRDMFAAVEKWWRDQGRGQDSLRNQLSREGVRKGDNHKPGVHDTGHGCGKPLALPKGKSGSSGGGGSGRSNDTDQLAKAAKAAVGGGILGDLVGGIVGSAGTEVLAGSSGYDGGRHTAQEYKKENKAQEYGGNYGDHGYKQKEKYGGSYGGDYEDDKKNKKKSKGYGDDDDDDKKYKKEKKYKGYDDDDDDDEYKKKKKDKKYKDYDDDDDKKKSKHGKKRSEEYGRSEYGQSGNGGGSYGRQQEHSQSAYREDSGYGRQQQSGGYGGDSYGQQQGYSESTRRDDSGYGRHQQSGGYGGASYGREQEHSQSTYRDDSGYGRHEQSGGYGGGQHQSGYGQERQTGGYGGGQGGYSSGYGQETRQQHGGYESQGRRRSKSRERESGRYESSAYGGRNDGRYGSEEREFGGHQSYQRRYDNDRDRSDDEGYDRRRQHHRRD
ncbi:hypothetical protein LOZ43_004505 [Ophidiomyces ophidiicola]|nr:hypothetical protein LOZ43_004505 [Ophidiomyces ophidiicola]